MIRKNIKIILLILLGGLSWSLTMMKSGLIYSFGMGFWGANGHDGVWHISLINSLARGTLEMPVFAGSQIKNYHIGFDLILALIHNLTSISSVTLYFQIVPPILAILTGVVTYMFIKVWRKSEREALWAVFFVYFGGDLGWIVTLIRDGKLGGESMFWSQQAISTLINPPFALSVILIFLGLILIIKQKTRKSFLYLTLSILIFGTLIEIKAYAGILVLGGLFVAGVFEYIKERKSTYLKIFLGSLVVSLVIFFILYKGSSNPFIFQPFWFLDTLFASDRFDWSKFYSALINYKLAHNWVKLIPAYVLAFVVFWIGNMWTRLFKEIKVFKWVKDVKNISSLDVFVISIILAGGIIPMFFIQEGTPWNTIQFFYYSLVFSGVLGGVAIEEFLKSKSKSVVFMVGFAVVVLTLPTTVSTLVNNYIPSRPPAKVSKSELTALDFLSKQKEGVVLAFPFDKVAAQKAESNPPRPLYLYDSTAYVSAFSNHPVFLEDEVNLNITGFDWRMRRSEVEKFLNTLNQNEARKFLKDNSILYIYWLKPQKAKLGESQLGLLKIFEDSEVDIYKVNF